MKSSRLRLDLIRQKGIAAGMAAVEEGQGVARLRRLAVARVWSGIGVAEKHDPSVSGFLLEQQLKSDEMRFRSAQDRIVHLAAALAALVWVRLDIRVSYEGFGDGLGPPHRLLIRNVKPVFEKASDRNLAHVLADELGASGSKRLHDARITQHAVEIRPLREVSGPLDIHASERNQQSSDDFRIKNEMKTEGIGYFYVAHIFLPYSGIPRTQIRSVKEQSGRLSRFLPPVKSSEHAD